MGAHTGWVEIVRRLIACLLFAGALATCLTPAPALIRVATVDFVAQQQRELLVSDRQLPLADYIAEETRDRLAAVQGPEWQAFFQAVGETIAGRPPNADWNERRSEGRLAGQSIFMRLGEAPLNQATSRLGEGAAFTYLALVDAKPTRYLGVTYMLPRDLLDAAPPVLAYPWRVFSVWLALLGLAVYILLPRPQRPPEAVTYSQLRAVWLPDLLGFFLFGVFFALPILVIPRVSSSTSLFDPEGGWIFLTLFGWLFALFGIVILAVATGYAVFQILLLPDRLRITELFGRRECLYRDMTRVECYTLQPPRWLLVFGGIVSLFNWRALAPTLMASRETNGIEISSKAGPPLCVQVDQLQGVERLLQAFRQQKVPVTAEAEALLAD